MPCTSHAKKCHGVILFAILLKLDAEVDSNVRNNTILQKSIKQENAATHRFKQLYPVLTLYPFITFNFTLGLMLCRTD